MPEHPSRPMEAHDRTDADKEVLQLQLYCQALLQLPGFQQALQVLRHMQMQDRSLSGNLAK